jgi:hypothetical protein
LDSAPSLLPQSNYRSINSDLSGQQLLNALLLQHPAPADLLLFHAVWRTAIVITARSGATNHELGCLQLITMATVCSLSLKSGSLGLQPVTELSQSGQHQLSHHERKLCFQVLLDAGADRETT